jgi:SNF2 family DNA or RNA helicase
MLAGYEWNRVVLDEAQAVKNSLSRAAKAVRQLRAGHRVALTGTPMENWFAELWSIMDFLNPGLLGSSGWLPLPGSSPGTVPHPLRDPD